MKQRWGWFGSYVVGELKSFEALETLEIELSSRLLKAQISDVTHEPSSKPVNALRFTCVILPGDVSIWLAENSQLESSIGGRSAGNRAFGRSIAFRSVRSFKHKSDENVAK